MKDLRVISVLVKALLFFLVCNLLFAWLSPLPALGSLSAYNHLFPGRARLPYGDHPERAYNLSLYNLEAMFASHELSGIPKAADELRVLLIGDSSTWGFLLTPEQTLAAQLNALDLKTPNGQRLRFFNLGYPVMSLAKDLLILDAAQVYQPDLIVWLFTLESFPYDKQLYPPLLQNNPRPVRELIQRYGLSLDPDDPALIDLSLWQRTLAGQRRPLADLLRLQLYGVLWAATGIDQDIPASYTPRQEDLEPSLEFHNLQPPRLQEQDLAIEMLRAGKQASGKIPLILVNEPMFISQGKNSDMRYNFFYPRWAYDGYRQLLAKTCQQQGWSCVDLWDAIPATEFTNSAVHLTPRGSALLAQLLSSPILAELQKSAVPGSHGP